MSVVCWLSCSVQVNFVLEVLLCSGELLSGVSVVLVELLCVGKLCVGRELSDKAVLQRSR